MKKIIIGFLLILSFSSAGICNDVTKIITFNIRLDLASDGTDQWDNRKDALVNYVLSENADFICIQEALYNQVTYIDSFLTDYKYIGVGRDDGKKAGEFMALFYKESNWNVEKSNTIWLSDTPNQCSKGWDAMCFRVCTWGTFINKNSGKKLIVNNTHLDHVGVLAREKSIELLISHIETLDKKIPIFLAGDFNLTPSDKLYTKLTNKLFDSKMLSELILESHEGTFNGFDKGNYDPPYKDRIDYVFCNKEYNVLEYRVPIILTGGSGHISDHFPVIVTIKLD